MSDRVMLDAADIFHARRLQLVRSWEELIIDKSSGAPASEINEQVALQQQLIRAATDSCTSTATGVSCSY